MTPEIDPHRRRICELPFWPSSIALEPLSGGITNRNYRVTCGSEQFVARIGEELLVLGVDRRNERLCHAEAERLGVAPGVAFAEDGVLVSRFIASRTLNPETAREPGICERVAERLRQLHEGWDTVAGDLLFFSPFQACRTYVATCRRLGAVLPDDIDAMLEQMRGFSRRLGPYVPALCHNDMLPANVLDDGDRIWIVDWEYAGMGHPLFDLAGFSVNCGFSDDKERDFLRAYRGEFRPEDQAALRILKSASLLREALWSAVQTVASDLDFDFAEYARVHFAKFRDAIRS